MPATFHPHTASETGCVLVRIPPVLRRQCGGADEVRVPAGTVRDLVAQMHRRFNGVGERLCDDRGQLRGSVLIFVNEENIRFLGHMDTPLAPGDEVSIVPAYAGG